MTNIFNRWFKKYFSDPEGVILAMLLLLGFFVVIFFGDMMAPMLVSVVLAYLLEGLVFKLERRNIRRLTAVLLVFVPFFTFVVFVVLGLFPLLFGQLTQLFQELPGMVASIQQALQRLPEHYPHIVSEEQVSEMVASARSSVTSMGQNVLSFSLASISGIITFLVFLVLVPVLIFFMLKDKLQIIGWLSDMLPRERGLATRIWREMDLQIGNYVRGKFGEILIVGVVSYAVFWLMGLQYAMLLGALVGLSVIIPYIGAAAVTLPVAVIAYFQWGFEAQFLYVMIAYGIIQTLDGNVLVPLLFSEAVNLHPIAIIAAVLLFGGIWGFWGVFFAIPLATLVKAVLDAWPRTEVEMPDDVPAGGEVARESDAG